MSYEESFISDLEREILIRVGHAQGRHLLTWSVLKKLGDSLENLITTLAENSQMFSKSTITKKDIKLDFSGFYDGSAVPAFKIADTPILMTETAAQLKRDGNYLGGFAK